MIKRVVVAGALVLALMIAVKDGRVLRTAGLTGACSMAQRLADGTQLEVCRSGKLAGRPDLSRNGCTEAGVAGTTQYWRCPAAVAAGH
jgi:hypothetical protein